MAAMLWALCLLNAVENRASFTSRSGDKRARRPELCIVTVYRSSNESGVPCQHQFNICSTRVSTRLSTSQQPLGRSVWRLMEISMGDCNQPSAAAAGSSRNIYSFKASLQLQLQIQPLQTAVFIGKRIIIARRSSDV